MQLYNVHCITDLLSTIYNSIYSAGKKPHVGILILKIQELILNVSPKLMLNYVIYSKSILYQPEEGICVISMSCILSAWENFQSHQLPRIDKLFFQYWRYKYIYFYMFHIRSKIIEYSSLYRLNREPDVSDSLYSPFAVLCHQK